MVCDQLKGLKDPFPPSLSFPIGEFPGKKKKLLVPIYTAMNFAYLNLIQDFISSKSQRSFV